MKPPLSAIRSASACARRRASANGYLTTCAAIACAVVTAVATYRALFPRIIAIGERSMAAYLVATSEGTGRGDLYYNASCGPTTATAVVRAAAAVTADTARQNVVADEQLAEVARARSAGGVWAPADCAALHHTAVLVCYRADMADELRAFLYHVHRFLQRQNRVHYRVYAVEQTTGGGAAAAFNRGKLFNAGYREVCERSAAGCFVFHDVGLVPVNPANVYGCTSCVRHMSANAHAFQYFGGAVAMTRAQYRAVNGYSNAYYGSAGLEDVDMFGRVYAAGHRVCRFDTAVSRYAATGQWPGKREANATGLRLLHAGPERYATDGVESVTYELLAYEELPLYTRILVRV